MIKNLEVINFKSIKNLKLDCKRVNVFIGEPNTGKSNILESLGIFSSQYAPLKNFKILLRNIKEKSQMLKTHRKISKRIKLVKE